MIGRRKENDMKTSAWAGSIFLLSLLSLLPTTSLFAAEGEASEPFSDVSLVSLQITNVKLTHTVDGEPSKSWTIKVFLRNQGKTVLDDFALSLTAWCGEAADLAPEKRYLKREGHCLTGMKRVRDLEPKKSKSVVFHFMTPKNISKVLFAAFVDCGELSGNLSAKDAMEGKEKGDVNEKEKEDNNYEERLARH